MAGLEGGKTPQGQSEAPVREKLASGEMRTSCFSLWEKTAEKYRPHPHPTQRF